MTTDKIIIIAEQCTLPDDDTTRKQLLQDAYDTLANTLIHYEVYPERVRVFDGNAYVYMEDVCPNCHSHLQLGPVSRTTEYCAEAPASCDCGWTGRAVYRIIDYEENLDTSTPEAMMDPGSCVTEHDYEPFYTPHHDATQHLFSPGKDK